MKLQIVALSFVVIGCFQLLDVDGNKKSVSVSEISVFVTRHLYVATVAGALIPFIGHIALSSYLYFD